MLKLGPWQADQTNYAIVAGTKQVELEPLLAKLLWFFLQHPQQIISRQQLADAVWQQGFVDDNAINRAISDLRKALQHPLLAESPLKTHHRKGYSLQWDWQLQQQFELAQSPQASTLNDNTAALRTPSVDQPLEVVLQKAHLTTTHANKTNTTAVDSRRLRVPRWLQIFAIVFIAIGATGVGWMQFLAPTASSAQSDFDETANAEFTENASASATAAEPASASGLAASEPKISVTQISQQQGAMTSPLLSSDKRLLAYTHATGAQPSAGSSQVIVRRFDASRSDTEEVNLLLADEQLVGQSWQHGKPVLLVKATNTKTNSCHYRTYDFSAFPAYRQSTLNATCSASMLLKAQLSNDGQHLYSGVLAEHGVQQGQQQIVQENLGSGQQQVLVIGKGQLLGISTFVLSPDNRQLAYYAYENARSGQLYMLQLETGETRRLTQGNQTNLLMQLSFDDLGQYLYAANGERLLRIATDGSGVQSQLLPADLGASELTLLDGQRGIVSQLMLAQSGRVQLRTAILQQGADKNLAMSWFDGGPASVFLLSPSPTQPQRLAYFSEQSGSWQLWLRERGVAQQLTELPPIKSPFNRLEWSPDGSQLVFGTGTQIWWYQLATRQLTPLHPDKRLAFPTFDPSGQSLVVQQGVADQQQLWRIQLPSGQLQRLGVQEGMMPQFDQGRLYYSRKNQLWRFVDGAKADELVFSNPSNTPWLYQLRHGIVSWVSLDDQKLMRLPLMQAGVSAAAARQPEQLHLPKAGLTSQMLPVLLGLDPHDPARHYLQVLVRPELQLYQLQWPAFSP